LLDVYSAANADCRKEEGMKQSNITIMYADVIIGTNPRSLENTGVSPINPIFYARLSGKYRKEGRLQA